MSREARSGLQRLLGKVGLTGTTASENEETLPGDDTAPADDGDESEGDDTLEGDDTQEGAGDGDEDSGAGDDAGEGTEADPAESTAQADTASASYQAGYEAAQVRWAQVLTSTSAQANMSLALELLADESNMSASSIIGICDRTKAASPGGPAAHRAALSQTPKPNTGADSNNGDPKGTVADAKPARAKAASSVNARLGVKGRKAQQAAAAAAAKTA